MGGIRILALGSASVLSLSMPAYAQSGMPDSERSEAGTASNEIIVEARRRQESVQDVPLVVNTVTSETIEKLNLRRFEDIASVVPGLRLENNPAIGANTSLRGVRHDTLATGINGTVAFYLNEAPVMPDIIYQALFDVGQIEVLRGPQGTLRGLATPSGSITITSRTPDLEDVGGYATGTLASGRSFNLNGAVNIPILRDVLAVRVGGLVAEGDGDRIRSVNSSIDPKNDTQAIRASVLFRPADFFSAGFTYMGLRTKDVRFQQVQSFALLNPAATPAPNAPNYGTIELDDRVGISTRPNAQDKDIHFYNWNAQLSALGQKLIYVGGRTDYLISSLQNQDVSNFFPALSVFQDTSTTVRLTSHEIRLQNDDRLFGMVDYVVGYFRNSGGALTTIVNPQIIPLPTGPIIFPVSIVSNFSPTKEESFFGNLTVHFDDTTEISGGLRRIKYRQDARGLVINGALNSASLNLTDAKATIFNASIKHKLSEDVMVYASAGSSWRPPNFQIGNFTTAPLTPLERASMFSNPERSKSYEIGIKSQWLDRRLTFNLSAFHQDFKNYPYRPNTPVFYINFPTPGVAQRGQFGFVSTATVKVAGIEAELDFRFSNRFNISNTVAWSKSKVGKNGRLICTDALNNASGSVGSDGIPDLRAPTLAELQQAYGPRGERVADCPASGLNVSFQPKFSGSTQAEYNMPISDGAEGYLRGLVSWRGKSQNDPNNRLDNVDAYALLNLYAGVRDPDGAWEATVFTKNVFKATEIVTRNDAAVQTSTLAGAFDSRYALINVTAPREFGVNLRIAFGSR